MLHFDVLLLFACAPSLDAEAPFYAPDEPGPYTAGVTTIEFTDARGKALVAEVWYPSDSDADPDPYEEIPLAGTAVRDADPVEGAFPLIAFSHGNFGIRYQSMFLTEWLAGHGFVVVAPDHPGNTLLDFDPDAMVRVALERPGDISSAVDAVLAAFGDRIASESYGMSGHSFGGWTTLAVAGGIPDWAGMQAFCAADDDYDLCQLEVPADALITPDPRAVAALSLAPAGWYSFGEHGLDTMAPTLLMGGELDDAETLDREILPLYERLPAPKELAILAGAGHYAFTDICLVGAVQPECGEAEAGYIELDRAHALIRTLATAFFSVQLRNDDRYAPWLGAIGEEISWQSAP